MDIFYYIFKYILSKIEHFYSNILSINAEKLAFVCFISL